MYMKRRTSFLFVAASIVLLILGFSLEFILKYQIDTKNSESSRQVIETNYQNFNNNAYGISKKIETASFAEKKYFQDIVEKKAVYQNEIVEIENDLSYLKSFSQQLQAECSKIPVTDFEFLSKCEVIAKNEESIKLQYEKVLKNFQEEVHLCNEWIKNNNDAGNKDVGFINLKIKGIE